jgi:DNA-binding MarR family transcriptional regulator
MNPEPATVKLLTERMIDKMSNASRLVDKLKSKSLVDRIPCSEDRRRVNIYITKEGLALLDKASELMEQDLQSRMGHLSEEEAEELSRLLDKLRS